MVLASKTSIANPILSVFVVEDEALTRLDISEQLREAGFRVYEATNAAQAIEILGASNGSIDLVFSDLQLTGAMDGIGLAQWVKQNRPALPILLTSGDPERSRFARQVCRNECFFEKPYEASRVVTLIRMLIQAQNGTFS